MLLIYVVLKLGFMNIRNVKSAVKRIQRKQEEVIIEN